MAKRTRDNYYEDTYIKYDCQVCKRSFILGEKLSESTLLSCPYCRSKEIEAVAASNDMLLNELELGCLGLYFHVDSGGQLKLYTEKDFFDLLKNPS